MANAHAVDRMVVTPHRFTVPLDWAHPDDGRTVRIAASEVVAVERQSETLPLICWFQGGPGSEASRPESRSGWLGELLKRYRVVLLDQRGTGLSTPLDSLHLPHRRMTRQLLQREKG